MAKTHPTSRGQTIPCFQLSPAPASCHASRFSATRDSLRHRIRLLKRKLFMVPVAAHSNNDTCPLDWHLLIFCVYATDFSSNYIVLSLKYLTVLHPLITGGIQGRFSLLNPESPDPTAARELQWRWAVCRHVMWHSAEVSGASFHS